MEESKLENIKIVTLLNEFVLNFHTACKCENDPKPTENLEILLPIDTYKKLIEELQECWKGITWLYKPITNEKHTLIFYNGIRCIIGCKDQINSNDPNI